MLQDRIYVLPTVHSRLASAEESTMAISLVTKYLGTYQVRRAFAKVETLEGIPKLTKLELEKKRKKGSCSKPRRIR